MEDESITSNPSVSRSTFLASSLMTALAVASTPQRSEARPATTTTTTTTTTISTETTKDSKPLEESISGMVAGASLATTKTIVKYPLDTATVRLQMPNSQYSIYQPIKLFKGSFGGISTPLVSNIPAGAVFFAVKDATKDFLKNTHADLPRWGSTSLAVLAATFPFMLVRNPSEVIKTRQQAGLEGYGEGVSAWEAFQKVQQGSNGTSGIENFYVGYWENVLYTYPADVIKFVSYENLSGGRKNLPPLEGAVYGACATAIAQFFTTPLDVVRNRVMADSKTSDEEKDSYLESLARIAKEEGIQGLFAGVSPRVGKAMLSGAIQFATYEETKQALTNIFMRR